jgi:hypothetical protein
MTFEESVPESGANTEGSSAPETASPASSPAEGSSQDVGSQAASQKETPFHEHPRFRELIEERNTQREQARLYQQQLLQVQQQMQEMSRNFEQVKSSNNKPSHEELLKRLENRN